MITFFNFFPVHRTDPNKRRLTGALCGLGLNPDDETPMLPDHDMEVTFDTKITADDIAKVWDLFTNVIKGL